METPQNTLDVIKHFTRGLLVSQPDEEFVKAKIKENI